MNFTVETCLNGNATSRYVKIAGIVVYRDSHESLQREIDDGEGWGFPRRTPFRSGRVQKVRASMKNRVDNSILVNEHLR